MRRWRVADSGETGLGRMGAGAGPAPGVLTPAGRRLGLSLVTAFLGAVLLVDFLAPAAPLERPHLFLALDALFLAGGSAAVAALGAWAYLSAGNAFFLWTGAGSLAFGLSSLAAGWAIGPPDAPNPSLTIHSLGVLLSALCYAAGARVYRAGRPSRPGGRRRRALAAGAYGAVVLGVAAVTAAALTGLLSPFSFSPGRGPTLVRQLVLAAGLACYIGAATLFWSRFARTRAAPFFWVWAGLALIAIGLGAILLQGSVGGAVGWTGRAAQYAGSLCVLWAIRDARLWAGAHGLAVGEATGIFLAESETDYRALVDSLAAAVVTVDGAGRVILWNKGAERLLGRRRQEALGIPLAELVETSPALLARLGSGGAPDATTRVATQLGVRGRTLPVEIQLLRPGAEAAERCTTLVIEDASARRAAEHRVQELHAGLEQLVEERTLQLAGKIRDLEEARRIAAASQHRFSAVFAQSHDAILLADDAGRFLDANPAACALLGLDRAGLRAATLFDVLPADQRAAAREAWPTLLVTGAGQPCQALRRPDGQRVEVECQAQASILPGLHLLVARDVSAARQAGQALTESEAALRAFFESPGLGHALLLLQGGQLRLLRANADAATLLGLAPGAGPADVPAFLHGPCRQVLSSGRAGAFLAEREGCEPPVWLRLRISPVAGSEGTSPRLALTVSDVSELQRARRALERSESELREAQRIAGVGSWTLDGATGALSLSEGAFFLFGLDPEAGAPSAEAIRSRIRPADLAPAKSALARLLADGAPAFQELVLADAAGQARHLMVRAEAVRDPLGRVTAACGTVQDVTELRRLEAHLEERNEFLRALLEHSPDLAAVIGPDRRYRFVGASVQAILGWSEAEMLGFTATEDLTHPDDRERAAAAFQAALAGPEGRADLTVRLRHKDGAYRLIEVAARNQLAHPIIGGLVVHLRDVTVRQALEAQLRQAQKLESIGRLAGGVAHDFNNALTVIMASAESLARDASAGRPIDPTDVDDVLTSSRRSRDIVRQLLAFARKQGASPVALDVAELVRGHAQMIRRLVGEGVALELELPRGLWAIRLDPTHLDQILLNLAANSRDALPVGGRVVIRATNLVLGPAEAPAGLAAGDYLQLEFTDDGLGMTEEVRAHLFEPFFTTKAEGVGTGLGLATVHGVVAQGGGRVLVRSAPGRGTTIAILFPRCAEQPAAAPEVARRAVEAGAEETILLVEDDPAVRLRVRRELERAGYRVMACGDGAESLDLLRAEGTRPDLVLADVVMPRLDGRRLAQLLRQRWPDQRIMFMTGYGTDQATGGVPGADLLEKPFSRSALLQQVRSALGRGPSA